MLGMWMNHKHRRVVVISYVYVYLCSSDQTSKAIFLQMAEQVLQLTACEIRCPSRAWKVCLHGEGADDAGGVFDETIALMCAVSSMYK